MKQNVLDFRATLQEWAVLFARRSIHDFLQFARQRSLSMAQISLLMQLYYRGSTTIAHFRQEYAGSRAAATQMIDDLVRAGLVERVESGQDRRLKVISLTQAGRELVEQGIAARRKWLEELAASFSEEESEKIHEVLRRMIQSAVELETNNQVERQE